MYSFVSKSAFDVIDVKAWSFGGFPGIAGMCTTRLMVMVFSIHVLSMVAELAEQ